MGKTPGEKEPLAGATRKCSNLGEKDVLTAELALQNARKPPSK